MKDRILLVSLLGVLSLGVCVGFAWVDFQRGGTVYVRKAENFRLEPKGDKIGVLEKGTSVIVLEDSRNWVKVRVEGWIWKDSLTDSKVAVYAGDYRAAQIVVSQLSTAEDIIAQLKKGGNFAELAAKHSIGPTAKKGGDLGYFAKGDFQAEFESVILALKPGEFSDAVKGTAGYHIFKRLE